MKEITNNNFLDWEKIKEKKILILGASWCGPCRALLNRWNDIEFENVYYADLTNGHTGRVKREILIEQIPLTIIFENGYEVNRIQGLYNPEDILDGSQDQA